ncbi:MULTISPECIES: hypothetical protein [Rothia]|jgi:hypothetical protein|uniref:hypothetical protein n=1 Tax=Rothia TaxID=32207 RepID=UPI0008A3BFE0|nr:MULTISPECIES: hypothetical protein [unclassified Rothia (in: high G+C Gram-positive bacteria)]OFJ77271.1 hypothetical protein HMPREF2842_01825 [Rothia sp. HMSC069C10]OFQ73930.1 hypothetical protein HMPREF2919_06610 [Rothia sp. HMSC068E02]
MVKRRVFIDDSVLLMSSQVIYGRPGSLLERIHRGEVQGILTEYSSSAWQIGEVVGYVPMEKSRETFDAKGFFTDWDGFTLYVLGPVLRMAFWSSLFIALVSPVLLSQSHIEISEGMELVLMNIFAPFFYFPPLILVGVVVGIWLLFLSAGKFLKAVEDAVESMRLFIGQHKIQHDLEFRQVYECTPLDGGSATALLHRIFESRDEEES